MLVLFVYLLVFENFLIGFVVSFVAIVFIFGVVICLIGGFFCCLFLIFYGFFKRK